MRALFVLLIPALLAGADIDQLKKDCETGKQQACLELLKSSDPRVRKAAVEKLTDQKVLAEIAVHDPAPEVSRAAAAKLTDQALLADVAKTAGDEDVRESATKDLVDQAILAEIARTDKAPDVRRAAVNKLAVRMILDGTPWDGKAANPEVAARNLAGQSALAMIAKTDSDPQVRQLAVAYISDQAVLADVARLDVSSSVRVAAVERLLGQEPLAEVVKTDKDAGVRRAALRNIGGRALRAEIAKTDPDPGVRAAAAGPAPPESHVYHTVVLTLAEVRRAVTWSAPILKVINQRMDHLQVSRRGWEFAVVRLKVAPGQGYAGVLQGYCSAVVDIAGKEYKSAVPMQQMVADSDYECPFVVPQSAKLATFRIENVTFDFP